MTLKLIVFKYNVTNLYGVELVCRRYLYMPNLGTQVAHIRNTCPKLGHFQKFRFLLFKIPFHLASRFLLSPSLLYNVIYRMQNISDTFSDMG